jgi:hypothetical protein
MARDQDELTQLRAEIALLRAQVQEQDRYRAETEAERKSKADFLAWINLTTQQKTQQVADRMFPQTAGAEVWEVQLQEQPKICLWAHSEFDAIGRYNQLCGITQTEHKHTAAKVAGELVGAV